MVDVWPPKGITNLRSKLDDLERLLPIDEHDEVTSLLARFLVIRSCGFLEQTAFEVCRAYVVAKSGGLVRAFARSWLEQTRNPSPSALEELVGRFDENLKLDLKALLDSNDEYLRRELALLVDRRNRIAHGLNEGLGLGKGIQLKQVACEVSDWFILRFKP